MHPDSRVLRGQIGRVHAPHSPADHPYLCCRLVFRGGDFKQDSKELFGALALQTHIMASGPLSSYGVIQILGCYVTKFAPDLALKLIARGVLVRIVHFEPYLDALSSQSDDIR